MDDTGPASLAGTTLQGWQATTLQYIGVHGWVLQKRQLAPACKLPMQHKVKASLKLPEQGLSK